MQQVVNYSTRAVRLIVVFFTPKLFVSHARERKEKNCLNCGAEVQGRYCHICGQENIETKETIWDLLTHFVYDITHFDGKFFTTLRYLIFRPGFLSQEYWRGRRASYLHPVRLYVFSSALFFFIVLALGPGKEVPVSSAELSALQQARAELNDEIAATADSILKAHRTDSLLKIEEKIKKVKADNAIVFTKTKSKEEDISEMRRWPLFMGKDFPTSIEQYDVAQKKLEPAKRDNRIVHYAKVRIIKINLKYQYRIAEFIERFIEKFMHSLPLMMLTAMPFIAVLLRLFYWRQKQYMYVNHGILTIHVFVAIYTFLLLLYGFGQLANFSHWTVFSWISWLLLITMFYYIYKSLRNFYHQKRGVTIFKFLTLGFLISILLVFLSIVFVLNSLLNV